MEYKYGDWVKCPGEGKVLWVYGQVKVARQSALGLRVLVDRGWFAPKWFDEATIKPAIEAQDPKEVAAIECALNVLCNK